eukprot:10599-Heterococcus_DN1.PRE.1
MPHASLRVAASHSEDMYTGSCSVFVYCIAVEAVHMACMQTDATKSELSYLACLLSAYDVRH